MYDKQIRPAGQVTQIEPPASFEETPLLTSTRQKECGLRGVVSQGTPSASVQIVFISAADDDRGDRNQGLYEGVN